MSFCSNVAKNKAVRPSVQRMHRRNAIEGTLSELTRGHGMRRSRYRGFGESPSCRTSSLAQLVTSSGGCGAS
jgi:hypothetical protein